MPFFLNYVLYLQKHTYIVKLCIVCKLKIGYFIVVIYRTGVGGGGGGGKGGNLKFYCSSGTISILIVQLETI